MMEKYFSKWKNESIYIIHAIQFDYHLISNPVTYPLTNVYPSG